ncbi:RNA-BINDING PROTEIN YLMH-RELATED [Salix purpurea]|uniref:RNA-BINDING PROTEIN YLMH-RELATED n=1 Tax=Salix purpurea TaxID=77065 RepID=A0A9Q1A322_SALPP|nr:RNA-BINDING PROTEIN YLMH-RELATED [Salix purpurea]
MSADFNAICGLCEAGAACQKDTGVHCNGDKNDDGPVNARADQDGELKGDGVESESETGVRDDQEDIQAVEEEREEMLVEFLEDRDVEGKKQELTNHDELKEEREGKLVEILQDRDVEGKKQELINHDDLSNAETQESQDTGVDVAGSELKTSVDVAESGLKTSVDAVDSELNTSVDVAESELNRSSNNEGVVEEESKFNLSVKEHEDSQALVINGVHNDLDLDQQSDLVEMNNPDDVAESEKIEGSILGSEDSQTVASNGLHNSLDLYRENKPMEFKPNPSSIDAEKVGLEEKSKVDSAIQLEGNDFFRPIVHNNLDLNQEKEPSELINDVPLKDSGEASGDSLEQNLETAPLVADEIPEAESDESLLSVGKRDGLSAGHAQDSLAETQVVDSLVDAKKDMSETNSENVELGATSDAETGKNLPIVSENGTSGDATNRILKDTVQSEVLAANDLDMESASQTAVVNDFVHASQMTPEHNLTMEINMEVSSHEVPSVNSCESFPISHSNGDMVAEPAVGFEDSLSVEDSKLCDIGTVSHSIEPEEKASSIQPGEKIDIVSAEVGKVAWDLDVVAKIRKGASNITKFPRYDENNKVKSAKFQAEKKSKSQHANQPQIQMKKFGDQNNQTAKTKAHAKPAAWENGSLPAGGKYWIGEPRRDGNKRIKAEEEAARKAEELRKEKEAAMLKEQRRLEEKAKAKEAMERRKRMADRAQARAALRAQWEAEQKEKEREKKAKKKERKRAAVEDAKDIDEIFESSPSSETPVEIKESERTEKPVTKRPRKPSQQTKHSSMPLPLRNRGKRRRQTWMWALLSLLVVIAFIFMGNSCKGLASKYTHFH